MIKYLSQEQTKLIYKSRAWLAPLILFALIMIAFPLSIDLFDKQTSDLFMIIIVISLLLTNYLAIDDILLEDYEDGSLEQFLTQNKSLFSSVLAKLIVLINHTGKGKLTFGNADKISWLDNFPPELTATKDAVDIVFFNYDSELDKYFGAAAYNFKK